MMRVYKTVSAIKDKATSILLTGETGTGKEVIAKYLHYQSVRRDKPFVAVIVQRSRGTCWNPSSLDTKKARSPEPLQAVPASSKNPPEERCSLMRSEKWTPHCRQSCFAFSRASSTASGEQQKDRHRYRFPSHHLDQQGPLSRDGGR